MTNEPDFTSLMSQIRNGNQVAAWQLLEMYGNHVLKVVRRRLNHQLRSKFDSQDFAQAVWKSFFQDRERLVGMQSPEQFVKYIQGIASNKVVDETRKRNTARYSVQREEPAYVEGTGVAARPSEIAVARETWERLMADQSADHQRIVELRFQGHTFEEIATELSINERTARRVIAKLLEKL
jgi:RNA polymerase sigma factor (sigma-70 family)